MVSKNSIRRILREESEIPASIRRRTNLSDEEIKKEIKGYILRKYRQNVDMSLFLHLLFDSVTSELLSSVVDEEMYMEGYNIVQSYLKKNYSDFISDYISKVFKGNEVRKFCFTKHSERWGGSGFTDCWDSWYRLINFNGYYVTNVEWDVVKKKLDELPVGRQLLISKPDENDYGYYFSIEKKE